MKRIIISLLALIVLSWPAISHAQYNDEDLQHPNQYNDVEDGQLLKLVSYILNPIGMGLEWGIARPLHYLATQTSAAPILSGDKSRKFFDYYNNAAELPPGTFGPYTINPSNHLETVTGQPIVPVPAAHPKRSIEEPVPPPEEVVPQSAPLPGGQSVIH